MNATIQTQTEISAVLNLIPYLDKDFNYSEEVTLGDLISREESNFAKMDKNSGPYRCFQLLKQAVSDNPEYGSIELVDQSSTNTTASWTDDLIQACTFRDADGNYYVTYRGTGDGRWGDNGDGMTAPSTQMQEAAAEYFDKMAEDYLIEASNNGKKIIVTGHSKGGNEAQYVYMAAQHEEIIDSCISLDGQGFSEEAIREFKERYGDEYFEKLEKMFSVNGTNDFVHVLGIPIIPKDNTIYVGTSENGVAGLHALENMIGDENGNYIGLSWTNPETGLPYEQGEISKLAAQLSEIMMEMNAEDLNGASIAIMIVIDAVMSKNFDALLSGEFNDYMIGKLSVNPEDFVDLFAHGLPVVLETMFLTKEGREILGQLLDAGFQWLFDNYGVGGVIGGLIVGSMLLTFVVAPLIIDVILLANIVDFAIDTINKIVEISGKIEQFITDIREAVVAAINKIIAKLKSMSDGYEEATANPQIIVDTYKLNNYAQRLRSVNTRITNLERRIDSLYWRVGLLDLWNLIQADILTGYSWRLCHCANYLSDTATDFVNVEKDLVSKVQ